MAGSSRRMRRVIALLAPAALLGACAALFVIDARVTETRPYPRSPRTPQQVELISIGNRPVRLWMGVAEVYATRTEWQTNADLVNAVRREAARAGLDGVMDFQCGPSPTFAYQCTGTGFVWR